MASRKVSFLGIDCTAMPKATANTTIAGTRFRTIAAVRLLGISASSSENWSLACEATISTGGGGGGMACASTKIAAKAMIQSARKTAQLALKSWMARSRVNPPRPAITELRM